MTFDLPEHLSSYLGQRTKNIWHTIYRYPENMSDNIQAHIVNGIAQKQELNAVGVYKNLTEIIPNAR
jgi:hypothetical protein